MDGGTELRQRSDSSAAGGGGDRGGGTSIHITALDGIINVNSLFTLAVFIGLAWNPTTDPATSSAAGLLYPATCAAGNKIEEDLVSFHVFAFSCFLFSSIVALCLKQAIRLFRPPRGPKAARVNRTALRCGIVVCALGSVFGCGFLMFALINVVQIKLGRLGCQGSASAGAIVPLVTLVPAAMLIYTGIVFYAFTR